MRVGVIIVKGVIIADSREEELPLPDGTGRVGVEPM